MFSSPRRNKRSCTIATIAVTVWAILLSVASQTSAAGKDEKGEISSREAHASLLDENRFPAAGTCRTCHPTHYAEWSGSPHAYAQMSVVYQSMQATIITLTNGTNGDFCIRCHTPVGMNIGEPTVLENEKRHPTSREGVTCITCHRVAEDYGRITGRLPIREGELCETVYGPSGGPEGLNTEVQRVLADPKVKVVGCDQRGRTIHQDSEQRTFLTGSGFCGTCHDVRLVNGFRLEDAFSEYNASPAAKRGETCQDCHMGAVPGVAGGYAMGPAAVVGGVPTRTRKITSHVFPGPDYSVIHPGIFPHNSKAAKMASISDWLLFDYEAGWGDKKGHFEKKEARKTEFPRAWRSKGKRGRARKLIKENCEILDTTTALRLEILQRGFLLDEVRVERADSAGIDFQVKVSSGTDGHGVPTGFDAERLVFLRVDVKDANGEVVYRSGDRDPNGDLRDLHSLYVHNDEIERDRDLFSLQSKFLTRNRRGPEREQVLPINFSPDPLPFLRPEARATGIFGRPRGARKQKQVILPEQHRWARYRVPADALQGPQPYTADVEIVAQMVPVNLIAEIEFMGFEYGMSAREIADNVVAGSQVLWRRRDIPLETGHQTTAAAERAETHGAYQCRDL